MKKDNIILVIALIMIVGAIYYFESQKAAPAEFTEEKTETAVTAGSLTNLSGEDQARIAAKARPTSTNPYARSGEVDLLAPDLATQAPAANPAMKTVKMLLVASVVPPKARTSIRSQTTS